MKSGKYYTDIAGIYISENQYEKIDGSRYLVLNCFYDDEKVVVKQKNGQNVIYTKYKRDGNKLWGASLMEEEEYLKVIAQ